ncbi:T9SS type A sorting domain-containing protein [Flavilitoribacter nigricans]|uniref:Secretion system C-terminal sorting domain-containing protein n=1 Tax=Flavilitoribacter nigricans (strain ATCC 23147 / DSM 23189 / NBRC 102662 / NCIMB 1420 / SS-2) TaxID=1122177 RepID=A0A2D0NB40_FLAN2|nr:T9SS type A sorting domain-containing protein [Flavilitoribacter nigricans]PHN05724.1 hypothetical protein CRP01_14705 [Flavilitoribacter nigricans DSM 23189 = NBRC 102662]
MKLNKLFFLLLIIPISGLKAQWKSLGSGIDASPRQIFTMHAVNEQVVWATTGFDPISFVPSFEFTRTTDGGKTWKPGRLQIDADLYHFDLFALDSLTAWVTTADEADPISGKIYKTTDGGNTWIHQASAFTGFNQTPASLYFWDAQTGVSFGATCKDAYDDQISIYTTDDGGDNWSQVVGADLPEQLPGEAICLWSGNSNYAAVGDTIWFFTSYSRVFRSTDRGKTWNAFLVRLKNAISIAFKDSQNGILVGFFPNGAMRTTDGGESWYPIDIPADVRSSEIAYVPGTAGTYLVQDGDILGDQDMLITHDDGDSWELLSSNENLSCLEFLSPTVGYAGGEVQGVDQGGIYRWEGNLFSGTVDVKESSFNRGIHQLELFPIPSRDEINISLPEGFDDRVSVEIFDLNGQRVLQNEILNGTQLAINALPAGMYLMKVRDRHRSVSRKFLKE